MALLRGIAAVLAHMRATFTQEGTGYENRLKRTRRCVLLYVHFQSFCHTFWQFREESCTSSEA
jgi:hypothetical protein